MADLRVGDEADEIAVALVQALARQDGDRALDLSLALGPYLANRPALRARHATWTAQAHQLRGELKQAITLVRQAIALAQAAGEADAIPTLQALKADLVRAQLAGQNAQRNTLPDTLLGRAVDAMDTGDLEQGASLARQARIEAQSLGNYRDEVMALLALARVSGQEDSAIRAAFVVADASEDKNLVTAVARAAAAAGVSLPKMIF